MAKTEPVSGYQRRLSRHAIAVHDRQKDAQDRAWDALATQLASRVPPGRLLDAGAGSGLLTERLRRRTVDVVAVDFNESMLEVLLERTHGAVPALRADIRSLPFSCSSFEGVLVSNVLHLVAEWRHALAEADRVLAAGGALMVNLGSGRPQSNDSPSSQVSAYFCALVEPGRPVVEQGPSSIEEVEQAMTSLRLALEEPVTATGEVVVTLRSVIERLEHNPFVWPPDISTATLEEAARQTRDWAQLTFGDVDAQMAVPSTPSVVVGRKRRSPS